MNTPGRIILVTCILFHTVAFSQTAFKVIPLGVKGGIDESNLSAYLLAVKGTDDYVCLDAGTLHYGLQKAVDAGIFSKPAGQVLKQQIKGYFISHAHLDHIAGLIINSPEDSAKNIYGLPYCLNIIKEKYFSWKSWANFADDGEKPLLKKYHYSPLSDSLETAVANTSLSTKAFTLSHSSPYESSAFLLRNGEDYVLYLGDTGADEIEKSNNLHLLWQKIAPLVKTKKLKGIFIEVSYPDEQPLTKLFGHLTPALLMKEIGDLGLLTGKDALKNLPVIITHMKPSGNNEADIKQQLLKQNVYGLNIIFPEQAKPFDL